MPFCWSFEGAEAAFELPLALSSLLLTRPADYQAYIHNIQY